MTVAKVLHVLIVDDDPLCTQILARLIGIIQSSRTTDIQLTICHSAEDALDKLRESCYDIVFTDIEMGIMSGDKMATTIRNSNTLKTNCKTPIIAITANYNPDSVIQYKKTGIDQCLEKPAKMKLIRTIIENRIKELATL